MNIKQLSHKTVTSNYCKDFLYFKARMFRNKINKPFDVALGLAAYL